MRCKFERFDWVDVDEDGGEGQLCHVPDPDSSRHRFTLRCHELRVVAPFNRLDARGRSFETDLVIGTVQERILIFF